jgi:hypothetical protein
VYVGSEDIETNCAVRINVFVCFAAYLGMHGAQGAVAFFRTAWASNQKPQPDVIMELSSSLAAGIFRKPAKGQVRGCCECYNVAKTILISVCFLLICYLVMHV